MQRLFLLMFAAVVFASALHAQVNRGNLSATGTFPLALVLERAQYAGDAGAWRPDWPFELPPDAFKVLEAELSRASIVGEGHDLSLAFRPDGLVEEFPFMMTGRIAQVSLVYNETSEIRELTIAFPAGEESWKIEFLEHEDSLPTLARGFRMNTWYFIYIVWGINEVRETWYDVEGNFLGAYGFTFADIGQNRRIRAVRDFSAPGESAEFHFDSRGLITEASLGSGLYRVLYFREDLPRYWERRPIAGDLLETGNFSFQWDVNGILVRITEGSYEDEVTTVDLRYEYDFDERGNWIERREIRMIRSMGHLVPTQGTIFRRVLEYRD
jgi:hypothetical protein